MVDRKKRRRIGVVDRQPFQGFEKDFGRVQGEFFIGAMRSCDELRFRAASYVLLKYSVRIVQVGDNYCEAGEIIGQTFIQRAIARKEAGQCPRFDGFHGVCEPALQSQLRDVRVTEYLQARIRELISQRREHRQCQDEVSDRAAADDEDFAEHVTHNPAEPSSAKEPWHGLLCLGFLFDGAEHNQPKDDHEDSEGQPHSTADANPIVRRGPPGQKIAQAPR